MFVSAADTSTLLYYIILRSHIISFFGSHRRSPVILGKFKRPGGDKVHSLIHREAILKTDISDTCAPEAREMGSRTEGLA